MTPAGEVEVAQGYPTSRSDGTIDPNRDYPIGRDAKRVDGGI
jgi:hypothetical protein